MTSEDSKSMKKLFLVGVLAVAAANATITPKLLVASNAGPYCAPAGAECIKFNYWRFWRILRDQVLIRFSAG